MPAFTIAGTRIELEPAQIERALGEVLPEPILEHYVIVRGRRYPPKQVISHATGLDRADFTTHQARRVLKRLGFVAARTEPGGSPPPPDDATHGGPQAQALAPYVGKWVALAGPTDVLVAAD